MLPRLVLNNWAWYPSDALVIWTTGTFHYAWLSFNLYSSHSDLPMQMASVGRPFPTPQGFLTLFPASFISWFQLTAFLLLSHRLRNPSVNFLISIIVFSSSKALLGSF